MNLSELGLSLRNIRLHRKRNSEPAGKGIQIVSPQEKEYRLSPQGKEYRY